MVRSVHAESVDVPQPADVVFPAALGVVQNSKNLEILAIHNEGRKLVVNERSKMSNAKFFVVIVEPREQGCQLNVAVGTDPRTSKALMDGRSNKKSLTKYLAGVQGAVDGSAPAPATPVANHYLQKKTEVPWVNADDEPDIQLSGNLVAFFLK